MKLGDVVHKVAQPIARGIDVVAGTNIEHCGGCATRRESLNNFGSKFYNYFFQPENRKPGEIMKFTLQMVVIVDAEKAEEVIAKAKPTQGELISFSVNPRPPQSTPPPARVPQQKP